MQILLVADRLAPDAPTPLAGVVADWYRDARLHHDVDLVAGYVRHRRFIPPEALGVDLCGRRGASAVLALRRAAARRRRRGEPDVLVTTALGTRCGRTPAIAWVHRPPDPADGLTARAWHARLGRFTRVVATHPAAADRLVTAGLPAERLAVLPPGLDGDRLAHAPTPGDPVRVACVGRLAAERGIHVVIDAVSRLAPVEKARVHLDVVGRVDDPVYVEQLRAQAWRQPVTVHTDVPDVTPYLRRADLVAHPAVVDDGLPMAALQALAGGIPCAWTDLPGHRTATAGRGLAVPPGDVPALRDVIRRALDDADALREQARAHRGPVLAERGRAAVWARWDALLHEVAASA